MIDEKTTEWQHEHGIAEDKTQEDNAVRIFMRFAAKKLGESGYLRHAEYFKLLDKLNGNRSAALKTINEISFENDEKELTKNACENIFYQWMDILIITAVKEWGCDRSLIADYKKRRPKDLRKPSEELDDLERGREVMK
jgi:hypothetical protein